MDRITLYRELDGFLTREKEDEKPVAYCVNCGEPIYSIDTVFYAQNEVLCCNECVFEHFNVVEVYGYDLY